ncbi:Auxin-responsive protein SAUR67 [Vitis vinifera]|uniref:Auxin-responsive protein SAUR67 n=1 Tax=Vitis vinifera TaxID=29760 RepID=A0A438EKW0_VITVI|nr:Auxin-responsive protein SAUR67 [Vitis vinifera]
MPLYCFWPCEYITSPLPFALHSTQQYLPRLIKSKSPFFASSKLSIIYPENKHDQSQETHQDGKGVAEVAAIRRKRISLPRTHQDLDAGYCSTSSVADKGHFVVYTADQRRFMIPIVYLNSEIFRELFEMSEEEFGLPSDGPITLPCDSFFMEYIIFLVQRGVAKDLEKALLTSVAYTQSSSSFFSHQEQMNSRLLVCSY